MPKTPQNSRLKVNQNIKGDSENAQNTLKKQWQRVDLNRRPRAYESPALPLSYAAIGNITRFDF